MRADPLGASRRADERDSLHELSFTVQAYERSHVFYWRTDEDESTQRAPVFGRRRRKRSSRDLGLVPLVAGLRPHDGDAGSNEAIQVAVPLPWLEPAGEPDLCPAWNLPAGVLLIWTPVHKERHVVTRAETFGPIPQSPAISIRRNALRRDYVVFLVHGHRPTRRPSGSARPCRLPGGAPRLRGGSSGVDTDEHLAHTEPQHQHQQAGDCQMPRGGREVS